MCAESLNMVRLACVSPPPPFAAVDGRTSSSTQVRAARLRARLSSWCLQLGRSNLCSTSERAVGRIAAATMDILLALSQVAVMARWLATIFDGQLLPCIASRGGIVWATVPQLRCRPLCDSTQSRLRQASAMRRWSGPAVAPAMSP